MFRLGSQKQRWLWGASLLCLAGSVVLAAPPPPPDAGTLLQQNQPPKPNPVPGNDTGLKLQRVPESAGPPSVSFMVRQIEISGNTLFDTATLHKLVVDMEGAEQTLNQLNDAVDRISNYYYDHGYPLSRAYIPAQTIQDGIVKVFIIEARYGEIRLNNSSQADDHLLQQILGTLQPDAFVEQRGLDRSLLILSDVPGVVTGATLQPGAQVGTSDLLVEVQPVPSLSANVMLDNDGNAYTGRTRLGGTVNWLEPFGQGDYFSASLISAGRDMNSGSLTYEAMVNGQGSRIGTSMTALHYRLGKALTDLDGHGTAGTGSLWWKTPWLRSVDANVTTQVQLDYKNLKDAIDSTGIYTYRHLNSAGLLLFGDTHDAVLAGAQSNWSANWKTGEVVFDNATAASKDADTARTHGRFVKLTTSYSRLQNFTADTALYVSLAAQWADGNLDSSEKMVAGGPYSVRAYDIGVLSGDTGVLGSLELRQLIADWLGGPWQAAVFADSQHITVNANPYAKGSNGASLSGAGVGLTWANESGWHLKVYAAAPVGSVPSLINTKKSTRGWAEMGVWF